MLQSKTDRSGPWTEIPDSARLIVSRKKCSICGAKYGKLTAVSTLSIVLSKQAIDHLLPRRFLEGRGINPHRTGNLLSVCLVCHGKKVAFEERIFAGDTLGFLQGLNQAGYPVEKVIRFALSVGLKEFGGFNG